MRLRAMWSSERSPSSCQGVGLDNLLWVPFSPNHSMFFFYCSLQGLQKPRDMPSVCLSLTASVWMGGRHPCCTVRHHSGTECSGTEFRSCFPPSAVVVAALRSSVLPQGRAPRHGSVLPAGHPAAGHGPECPSTGPCSWDPAPQGHCSLLCALRSFSAKALG